MKFLLFGKYDDGTKDFHYFESSTMEDAKQYALQLKNDKGWVEFHLEKEILHFLNNE